MKVDKQQQIISDSISKLMGSLSHMTYTFTKFKKDNYSKIYRFETKQWGENIEKKYFDGIYKTYDGISTKYPIFADLMDKSNIYLDHYITQRKMVQVADINKLFTVYDSDEKLYRSIISRINKNALESNIQFKNVEYKGVCSLYVSLLFVKHSISTCMDKTVLYLTKDFKNCVDKGLHILSKHIHKDDIEYYHKACNSVYVVDIQTLFSIADISIAYNFDKKSLLGITKNIIKV